MNYKKLLAGSACVLSAALASGHALGDTIKYPERAITILVGYPAGQSVDMLARLVGEGLSKQLGQPVVIDNRPGAGGTLATQTLAQAAPDGYTLSMGASGPLAIAPHLFSSVKYDPRSDLTPLMNVASVAQTLVVAAQSDIQTMQDFVDKARSSPGALNFASPGNGSTSHLTQELFKQRTDTQMTHIPYKGGQAAITDLIGGEVDVLFEASPTVTPFIRQGQLRALAVSTATRIDALPDTPTVASQGLEGFEAVGWMGLVGPADMDRAVVEKLHAALVKTMGDPEVKQKLESMGMIPVANTPAQFTDFIKSEYEKWGDVIAKSGAIIQ